MLPEAKLAYEGVAHESYLRVFADVQAAFGEQAFADFDHFMAGTPIAELQALGAWKSELMVKRYAHFAPEQLRTAATRLGTFLGTPGSAENAEARTTS